MSTKRAFSLVEILVVLVVIMIMAAIIFPRLIGGGSNPNRPTPKSAMKQTNDSVCLQNLGSVRQCIMATKTGDAEAQNPRSLDELRELGADLKKCPVGGEPYIYDPQTGTVRCAHPGHESY